MKSDSISSAIKLQQLDRLKQASGITGLPGRGYLFADTSFGGRASPDGNIYIPYAMLQDIGSTDELAALLAHIKQGNSGVMRNSDAKLIEDTFTALMVSDGFINPGWTRGQELEADKLGVDLLIAAGYNSDAMFTLLDKMAIWEERNRTAEGERNALIDQLFMVNDPELEKTRTGELLGGLLDKSATSVGSLVNRLSQNHDAAEKRYDSLLTYVDTHHSGAPTPALEVRNWRAISRTRKTEQIWQGLVQVVEAREKASRGRLAESEKLMGSAVNPHTTNQNFLRQSFYEVRAAQKQKASMQQNLALGLKGGYPSLTLHVEQARLAGANPTTAKNLLSTFDQYGRPPTFYQHVITMAAASELSGDVLALKAECTVKYMGEGIACGDPEAAAKSDLSYGSLLQSLAP